jgi:hypothetical protein
MTGTPSRTARVSTARWNLKEAEGKLPTRGTRIAYEAASRWARGRIDPKPDVIRTESAYMRRVGGRKVTRLTLRDLSSCLDTCEGVNPSRSDPRAGLDLRDQWPRSLVECWRQPHEPGGPHSRTPPAWSRQPRPGVTTYGTFKLNRRIRNRTYGGVVGRRRQPRLLPDAEQPLGQVPRPCRPCSHERPGRLGGQHGRGTL